MKHLTLIIVVSTLILSCQKNIEIDENRLFIKGGIKSGLVIVKVKDNRFKKDNKSFPLLYSIVEKARLKINGEGISTTYNYGEEEHFLNKKAFEYKSELYFNIKNDFYEWTLEKPTSNKTYEKLPINLEKEHWYIIHNITFRGSNSYLRFYINKNGEFEYDDLKYVMVSPI